LITDREQALSFRVSSFRELFQVIESIGKKTSGKCKEQRRVK